MSNNAFYASKDITWSTARNQNTLIHHLTSPTFTPRPWQAEATATILDGCDLLLIAGTGQGKSSIIYLPVMARPNKITLVVTPTVLLQQDHACIKVSVSYRKQTNFLCQL